MNLCWLGIHKWRRRAAFGKVCLEIIGFECLQCNIRDIGFTGSEQCTSTDSSEAAIQWLNEGR